MSISSNSKNNHVEIHHAISGAFGSTFENKTKRRKLWLTCVCVGILFSSILVWYRIGFSWIVFFVFCLLDDKSYRLVGVGIQVLLLFAYTGVFSLRFVDIGSYSTDSKRRYENRNLCFSVYIGSKVKSYNGFVLINFRIFVPWEFSNLAYYIVLELNSTNRKDIAG